MNLDTYLTPAEACAVLKICRNTLAAMIRDGRVQAVNLNPLGKRPSWRVMLNTTFSQDDPAAELKWLDLKRRCGL